MNTPPFEQWLRDIIREEIRATVAQLQQPTGMLTVSQAAALADVHPQTIQRALRNGDLQRHGKGRMTRVDADDVRAWLAKPRAAAKDDPVAVAHAILRKASGLQEELGKVREFTQSIASRPCDNGQGCLPVPGILNTCDPCRARMVLGLPAQRERIRP